MPAPGARAAAKSAGMKTYFTGDLCQKGHLSERWTTSGQCRQCCNIWRRQYQENRPVKVVKLAPDAMTRAMAKAAGLVRYYTGKPCKNGHVSERATVNGSCLGCGFGGAAVTSEEHRKKRNEYMRKWSKGNEAAREKDRIRRQKPELLARAKLRQAAWKKSNRLKHRRIMARLRKRTRIATPCWLTKEHKTKMDHFYWVAQDCRITSGLDYQVDHIVPINGKNVCGLHAPWNLQVLPADVNRAKSNLLIQNQPSITIG